MSTNREASKRKVMALAERFSHSSQDYRTALLQLLREFVPFDGACCTAVDPQTLLSTGAITEDGVEAIHHGIFEHEYLREDFNRYDHLSKAAEPVATLSQATDGQLARSDRYRNVLLPAGFHDEMRASLKYDGACWGYLTLFRSQGRPFFSEQERECILALAPLIGYQLRKTSLSLPAEENTWMEEEIGILMLSDQFTLLAANPTAEKWLTLLRQWESIDRDTLLFAGTLPADRIRSQDIHGKSLHSHARWPLHDDSGKPDEHPKQLGAPGCIVRSRKTC